MRSVLPLLIALPALVVAGAYENTVYLIRHAEKPEDGGVGLTPEGKQRALCLKDVFGPSSPYNIGHIIAQGIIPETGRGNRSFETVVPLSKELGLPINMPCTRRDVKCVAASVETYAATSSGKEGVVIVWAHSRMPKIAHALGVHHPPKYPDPDYDWIWVIENGKMSIATENCPGLDDKDDVAGEEVERGINPVELYHILQTWIPPLAWWRY